MKSWKSRILGKGVEGLEARRLMAGDVTVFHDFSDTLFINGDLESNSVLVESTGARDQIRLTGLPTAGGPTTINGLPSITVDLVDYDVIVQQILTDLGDGNDQMFFENATLQTNLQIDTGAGNDDIEFTVTQVRGSVDILGTGVDDLTLDTFFSVDDFSFNVEQVGVADINDARIFGNLTIASAGGNNTATDWVNVLDSDIVGGDINITTDNAGRAWVTESSAGNVTIAALRGGNADYNVENSNIASLTVDTRGGSDSLHVGANTISGAVRVTSRGGADSITFDQVDIGGTVDISSGGGNDTLYVDQGEWGNTTIRTQNGDDNVTFFDTTFLADLTINTGRGEDEMLLSNISTDGTVNLNGGADEDIFDIVFGDIGADFNVNMGSGNDELTVRNNTVGEDATWNGGSGIDTLINDGTNSIGGLLTILNF